jgi:hypothetical protein
MTFVALAVAGVVAIFAACGTDAVGIQQCRDIESARCMRATACKIDLSQPLHEGSDVDSCIRFYNDQCLHGLVTSVTPGTTQVNACIAAINSGNCDFVLNPQDSPACTFLIPLPDAGTDAADASEDADDDSGD